MKAMMVEVPEQLVASRKRTGADQWDEMWNGVLHMAAMPINKHQHFAVELLVYLRRYWARPRRARVYHEVNLASVGGWPGDYRVPDLVLLSKERFHIDRGKYFEGAPDALVEIHSPGDETYDKLPFYEELKVPEVWIIHRDTKEPEVYVLKRGRYRKQPRTAAGWVRSHGIGVEMRAGKNGKLVIRMAGDDATREEIPED